MPRKGTIRARLADLMSPYVAIAAASALLVAAIWGTAVQRAGSERAAAVDAANHANANLAIAYAENVQARIDEVERLLRLLDTEYSAHGGATSRVMDDWPYDHALVRWIAVFDRHGRLATASRFRPPWTEAAKREFFAAHGAAERPRRLFIGRAQRHVPAHEEWSMVLSRPRYGRDGAFEGVVAAEIDPAQLASFQDRVNLGRNGGVTLLGLDGFARVRQSGRVMSFNTDMRDSLVMEKLAGANAGSIVGRGRFDSTKRHYSFRRLQHYPIAVTVGTDVADIFSASDERRRMYYLVAAIASLMVAGAALGLGRAFAAQRRHYETLARSEAATRHREAELRAVVECASDGIVVYDTDLHIRDVNPAAERILGRSRGELVGSAGVVSVFECVNPDGTPMRQEDRPTRLAVRTGQPQADRLVGLRRGGGETQWLSFNVARICAPGSGEWLGMVSTFSDVTRDRRTQEMLRESEALFRATFEQGVVGMGHSDMRGRIVRVNARLCEILGYAEAEILGRNVMDIFPPQERAENARLMETLVAHPEIVALHPAVRPFLRKDGSNVWGLMSTALLRDAHGAPAYYLGMVQDVTELKNVEQRKDEFISTVSHELRTPLTSIHGSLGLLAGGVAGALAPKASMLVNVAHANCERLILLVNDILDLEKIASGQMRFEPRRVGLGALVAECLAANEGFAQKHGVALRREGECGTAQCEVDPQRLNQALTNLVSNAIKYSPQGESVVVRLEVGDGRARIEVRDRGPGIPPEFRARIFQRFSQADGSDARQKGGTGLGLCIARSLVERMGGTIGYDSAPGAGTTFFMELPVAPAGAMQGMDHGPARGSLRHQARNSAPGMGAATK